MPVDSNLVSNPLMYLHNEWASITSGPLIRKYVNEL